MAHIAIPIPSTPGKQDIEIDVTINGKKHELRYRVEIFYWDDCTVPTVNQIPPDRVECLRELIARYDQDWSLYYIGAPTDDFVPIAFVRKADRFLQRKLMTGTI